MSERGDSVFYS